MGNGRFSDGFLLGLIIGGGIALLFTTKKGNKILKVVSEEGFEGLSKFIEDAEDSFEDQDSADLKKTNGDSTEASKEVKPHRRFFRRSK